eukprot:g1125.t1
MFVRRSLLRLAARRSSNVDVVVNGKREFISIKPIFLTRNISSSLRLNHPLNNDDDDDENDKKMLKNEKDFLDAYRTDREKIDTILSNEKTKNKLSKAEREFFVHVYDHDKKWRKQKLEKTRKELDAKYGDNPQTANFSENTTVGNDEPLETLYHEQYLYAPEPQDLKSSASGRRKGGGKKSALPQVNWVPGDRGDGIDTLVDYDTEPFHGKLKGKRGGDMFKEEAESYDYDVPKNALSPQELFHAAGYTMWYLYDDRVVKMTAKGKKQSFRALVCVGNGNGTAGYGVGKADSVPIAYDRALMDARKNLIYLDLCEGKTLWEPLYGEWNNTKVVMKPSPRGHLRVSDMVLAVANCFGITQLSSKTFGRNNPYVVIKAIFDAFHSFRTMEDIALTRGKRMVDVYSLKDYGDGTEGEHRGAYTRT